MSYGDDFASAGPTNAPLDGPLFIGADPFVWGAILLGLAAALLLGWYLGTRANTNRADAAQAIWAAINDAARSAMAVDDNALKGRAEHLLKVVEGRLGKTLALAGGMSGGYSRLKDAVAGKGPAGSHGHGGGHGPAAHPPTHEEAAGHGTQSAPAVIVNVTTGATPPTPGEPHPPAHDGRPDQRDLYLREQTDALRLAVAHFAEHWRDEAARVREMRNAHAELSNPGSPRRSRPPAGRISGARAKH